MEKVSRGDFTFLTFALMRHLVTIKDFLVRNTIGIGKKVKTMNSTTIGKPNKRCRHFSLCVAAGERKKEKVLVNVYIHFIFHFKLNYNFAISTQ